VNYIEFQKCCSIIFTLEKKKIFTTLDEFDFFWSEWKKQHSFEIKNKNIYRRRYW
jgi:hypothetical protein